MRKLQLFLYSNFFKSCTPQQHAVTHLGSVRKDRDGEK